MLQRLRAWDIAHENFLQVKASDNLKSAVDLLLKHIDDPQVLNCAIVYDNKDRFVGTLSTHRVLRAIGNSFVRYKVMKESDEVGFDRAVHAACSATGALSVASAMWTKTLEVNPEMPVNELLEKFSESTAHFAVVTEAGKALGLLDLDDLFRSYGSELIRVHMSNKF